MRCIIDTDRATTKPGSTLRLFREPPGRERHSNSERGAANSVPNSLPQTGDIVAQEHWCSSGFANTDLDLQLKRHGIRKLIVAGLIAHTCVESTVRFAVELGYDVTLVKDATADYSEEFMHAALVTNLPNYASAIVTAQEVADALLTSHQLTES